MSVKRGYVCTCVWAEGEVQGVWALLPEQTSLWASVETVLWFALLSGSYTHDMMHSLFNRLHVVYVPSVLKNQSVKNEFSSICLCFLSWLSAGVSEEAGPKAWSWFLPPETNPTAHQVPAASEGFAHWESWLYEWINYLGYSHHCAGGSDIKGLSFQKISFFNWS